ncbi:hypothetical protein FNL37_2735 [Methylovorus glucosotrophus]|uniref:hypothetical protein n=1 Tax=Methylovorus glucosotrophus TaxID=266009 RepID=UPI001331360A|nr:hypothetical protein [Methylovorus glucosotrophus]KAF0836426.1 hypothetical protein FNL37_2735 [Methylovorus glucosotrophus]
MSSIALWKLALSIGLGLCISVLAVIDPTKPIILASIALLASLSYLGYKESLDGKTSYPATFAAIFLTQRLNSFIKPQAGELIGLIYAFSLITIGFSVLKIYQLRRV